MYIRDGFYYLEKGDPVLVDTGRVQRHQLSPTLKDTLVSLTRKGKIAYVERFLSYGNLIISYPNAAYNHTDITVVVKEDWMEYVEGEITRP